MTIDEIQSALKYDMDMHLFDAITGESNSKESLKYGNEMNYIHYCAEEEAIELLDELKDLRNFKKCFTALDNTKLLERVDQEVENARRELYIIQRLDMSKEIRNKLNYEVDKILYNININIKEQLMIRREYE